MIVGFLNNSMSNSVQRYLSFEIGRGNNEKTAEIFSTSILAHFIIAILVVAIVESIGPWFIQNKMTIPDSRLYATQWVLQCSLISIVFGFFQVPYNALIIAKEHMTIYAYGSIIEVILRLTIVYVLLMTGHDKLIIYAILQMVVTVMILLFYHWYCKRMFAEVRFKRNFDKKTLREVGGFATWNLIGEFAWAVTGSGVNIIINLFCGPAVNAARGLAEQVNGAVNKFINNFQTAINPQIIKKYSVGEIQDMEHLVGRGTRFSFYLLLLLSLPLILEMKFVLSMWLVEVPHYSVEFCQLILICSLVSIVTNLFAQVVRATGKIRKYQTVTALFLILNFPLSYILLYLGYSPLTTMIVAIAIQVNNGLLRLYFVRKMVNYDIVGFIKNDFFPIILVLVTSCLAPVFVVRLMNYGILRFVVTIMMSTVSVVWCSYCFGIEKSERTAIKGYILKYLRR